MNYVKVKIDGSVDKFPYSLGQLVSDNPGTSFPEQIPDVTAASFNVFPVAATPSPDYDYTKNLSSTATLNNDVWTQTWISTPATPQEIASRTADKKESVRIQRNRRLADCDWTQLPDAPVDRATWATYRQALRDVTAQPGFPWSVTWPVEP